MSINIGIVGLPNVGKSTLFNALSSAGAESANFPFCTIEPNVGVVPVPDPRLDKLAALRSNIAGEYEPHVRAGVRRQIMLADVFELDVFHQPQPLSVCLG